MMRSCMIMHLRGPSNVPLTSPGLAWIDQTESSEEMCHLHDGGNLLDNRSLCID